ncbi:MAG: electron transfer flavoprotein subunit alpha/FixB family protein [Acidimicrobiales bacterium]|jgi:electron transfer flavoprotein alpha subunit
MGIGPIWVLAEQRGGTPMSVALELLGAARSFSSDVSAITFGPADETAAEALAAHGASSVVCLGDLSPSLPAPKVAGALQTMVAEGRPHAVFFATTFDGREAAARLSARLRQPLLANVIGLELIDDVLFTRHVLNGGEETATARLIGPGPGIYLLRPKCFAPLEPDSSFAINVVHRDPPTAGRTDAVHVLSHELLEQVGPRLDDAEVVVTGGRGFGSRERYAQAGELAALLHGATGATRAVVDAGWAPYSAQVGQTGKTVKPNVYIACGVSGAIQHLVGMKDSSHIVAINKDPDAAIFKVSDLGIVADVNVLIPRLIQALKARS